MCLETSNELVGGLFGIPCLEGRTNLFNQIDTGQQVHTEIDEGPIDTFPLVFFLLQNEHVMVEELLQLLVGEVNTQLLETVVLDIIFL